MVGLAGREALGPDLRDRFSARRSWLLGNRGGLGVDAAGSGHGERQQADANATVCLRRPSTGTAPLRQLGCYDHRATRTAPYLAECSVHQRSPVGISTAINGRPWLQIAQASMPSRNAWQSAYAQEDSASMRGAIQNILVSNTGVCSLQ